MFNKAVGITLSGAFFLLLTQAAYSNTHIPKAHGKKKPVALAASRMPQGASGDCLFGVPYPLSDSFKFTLKSAEYRISRVNIGDNSYMPKASEKLLVLHYALQNPRPYVLKYDWQALPFRAVDADSDDFPFVQDVGIAATHRAAQMDMQPGQSQPDLYTVIVLPASGAASRLIAEGEREGSDEQIIHYDLAGKVKPLAAPFADPKDSSGATALALVPAQKGIFYPMGYCDARLDAANFTSETLGGKAPDDGTRYLQALFTIQNKGSVSEDIEWSNFTADLRDTGDLKIAYNQYMLLPTSDDDGGTDLDPDAQTQVRFFWPLPNAAGAKTILLSEGDSRTYAFDVTDLK